MQVRNINEINHHRFKTTNPKLGFSQKFLLISLKTISKISLILKFCVSGLQHILNRIPHVRSIYLEDALDFVKHNYATQVSYHLKETARKRGHDDLEEDLEPLPGASSDKEPLKKKQKKKGTTLPKDDAKNRKYSSGNIPLNLRSLILKHLRKQKLFEDNPELCVEGVKLISSSLAKRTWEKYGSALSLWNKFVINNKIEKFSGFTFTCWCSKNTSVKASTIKSYLCALRKIKFLLGFKQNDSDKGLEKILLRGIENIENNFQKPEKPVIPVSLEILENIRKGLNMAVVSSCSKKSLWALSLTAFWGLIRLGEILPSVAKKFDKTTTLLWKDVELSSDKVILHIKSPKTRSKQSKTVVLYKLSESLFCPVFHLSKLKNEQIKRNLWKETLPVFLRSSGKSLTKISFIEGINAALQICGIKNCKLQGKSFRSGIPSLIGVYGNNSAEKSLKILGRWKGQSYRCYVRNPVPEDKDIFEKVSKNLLKNFLRRKRQSEEEDPDPGEQ
jgi:hypothetical protein